MLPACIYGDKKLTTSADGSIIFYSLEYAETYRAKSIGAFTESFHKFVKPSGILKKAAAGDVRILDLCFGLGYNCAVTFECLFRQPVNHTAHIVSVEKDSSLIQLIDRLHIMWPVTGYHLVKKCLKDGKYGRYSIEMYNEDAQDVIYNLKGTFDTIYFDPFSISKNPDMWSVETFRKMKDLLATDGALLTYASGKKARQAMQDAGLTTEDTPPVSGANAPGTKATKQKLEAFLTLS